MKREERKRSQIVAIANVSGRDETLHRLIKDVLNEHGIWSTREGSVFYAIMVETEHAQEAMAILTELFKQEASFCAPKGPQQISPGQRPGWRNEKRHQP